MHMYIYLAVDFTKEIVLHVRFGAHMHYYTVCVCVFSRFLLLFGLHFNSFYFFCLHYMKLLAALPPIHLNHACSDSLFFCTNRRKKIDFQLIWFTFVLLNYMKFFILSLFEFCFNFFHRRNTTNFCQFACR